LLIDGGDPVQDEDREQNVEIAKQQTNPSRFTLKNGENGEISDT